MKHKILIIYSWFIRTVLFFLPDIPVFMRIRGWCYGLGMANCGRDFQVTHDAIIKGLQYMKVGRHVFIGDGTIIMGYGTITIEDEVMIAPHCIVISSNHVLLKGSFRYGKGDRGHIQIGRGAWVAGNCTIQRGASLPAGSVLSANSFLNKAFSEEDALYGGVPARFIKSNIDDLQIYNK